VTPTTSELPIRELSSQIDGRLITPDDAEYDAARSVKFAGIDPRPACIVRVADASDVARVVAFARETGAELAVRCGGHSGAGHGTTQGGIVIDLRDLKEHEIDAAGRTMWAGAGMTAGEVTVAAAAHGLAIGFGDTGSVGIGGITLGGGIGYLVRRHGMTIDSLLAVEMVTADGTLRLVDAESDPDLFWAIRGGGGNFGVVTRFRYRLHELDEVVGGMLVLPASADVVAGFMAAAASAPDDLSTICNVMPCPPMPFIAEEHHGSLVVMALVCFAGAAEEADAALAPFRGLATPLADTVRPITYPEMFPPEDESYAPTAVARTMLIDRFEHRMAQVVMEHLAASNASMRVAQLRTLGGAMARVPADATAFAHRDSAIMVNVAAFYDGPGDRPEKERWVAGLAEALDTGNPGAYVNFVGDEGERGVRAAYPERTWERLAAIKARYDPTNLFHRNQNVPPAAARPA
jgi:FAD/FMN-containing dehydrogenase